MRTLLVTDMENDFVGNEKDIPIMHIYQEHRNDMSDFGLEPECPKPHCIQGTFGAKSVDEIEVKEKDQLGYHFKIVKDCTAGAFYDSHEATLKYVVCL
jgi:nicotinamidase-related amidase